MNRVTLTIHLDLPDGVIPDVSYDEPPMPLFDEAPLPTYAPAPSSPACPTHGPMKRYPAGTNKASKPYNASWRCATSGCETKAVWDRD